MEKEILKPIQVQARVRGSCRGCVFEDGLVSQCSTCEDRYIYAFVKEETEESPAETEELTKREKIALAVLPSIDTGSIEADVRKSLSYADVFLKLSKETNK